MKTFFLLLVVVSISSCATFKPNCKVTIGTNPPAITFACDSLLNAVLKNGGTISIPPITIPVTKKMDGFTTDVQIK